MTTSKNTPPDQIDFSSMVSAKDLEEARKATEELHRSLGIKSGPKPEPQPQQSRSPDDKAPEEGGKHPLRGQSPVGGTCSACKFGIRVISHDQLGASLKQKIFHCFGHPPVPVIIPTPSGLQAQLSQIQTTENHWCHMFWPREEPWVLPWMLHKVHVANHQMIDHLLQLTEQQKTATDGMLAVMRGLVEEVRKLRTMVDDYPEDEGGEEPANEMPDDPPVYDIKLPTTHPGV